MILYYAILIMIYLINCIIEAIIIDILLKCRYFSAKFYSNDQQPL